MDEQIKIEAAKFTLVGAANFILTLAVFTVLLKAFSLHYLLSLSIAWLVGMTFSYTQCFLWVFRSEKKVRFKTGFLKFFLASALSFVLNLLGLRFLVESTAWDPFYLQLALIPLIVAFNFSAAKYWSLRAAP
jgi:putative flippase GtrA